MEKELLQKAIDSILHGSTQIISSEDSYGNVTTQEVRINDLRIPLIEKLASKLVQTDGFSKALENVFTTEVMKKIQDSVLENMKWSDLSYRLKEKLEKQMMEEEVTFKKFKMTVEVIEKEK